MLAIVLTLFAVPSSQASSSGAAANNEIRAGRNQPDTAVPDSSSAPGGADTPSGDTGAQRLVPRVTGAVSSGAAKPTSSGRVTAKVAPESSAVSERPFAADSSVVPGGLRELGSSVKDPAKRARAGRSETCRSARIAAVYYRFRTWTHQELRDGRLATRSPVVGRKSCHWAKFAAATWKARASSARRSFYRWLDDRTLEDFRVTAGGSAWFRAVEEAQRAYPGTAWWLKSCSSTEGGWGRWVPNSDGAPPGGWMQMYESTFWRMWGTAWRDVTARGFRVPRSAHSWYSPLGQALASAWGLTNGRRGEWNSSGC